MKEKWMSNVLIRTLLNHSVNQCESGDSLLDQGTVL